MGHLKRCKECGQDKPLNAFQDRRDTKSGKRARCNTCISRSSALRRKMHPEIEKTRRAQRIAARPEWEAWYQMIRRCEKSTHPNYARYGGRGIKVCERWHRFESFIADMGPRPDASHTLDRVNNDGNYEPNNCRWATRKEQAINTSTNRLLTVNGRTLCVMEWSRVSGVSHRTIRSRLRLGMSAQDAVFKPSRTRRDQFAGRGMPRG